MQATRRVILAAAGLAAVLAIVVAIDVLGEDEHRPGSDTPATAPAPTAPEEPRTIQVTGSSYKVTSDLADVIFEVTGDTDDDRAVFVDRGVRLSRCIVRTNGKVAVGIEGGIVEDCAVHDATHAGFQWNDRYEGTNLCERCSIGFVLGGTDVSQPAGAMLRAEAPRRFGAITVHLKDSRFEGRIRTDNAGGQSATGFEVYEDTQRVFFADVESNEVGGYVAAVARFTDAPVEDVEIASIRGRGGDDPGLAITGGVRRVTIGSVDLDDVTFGLAVGEDHAALNREIAIRELRVERARWGCVRLDRVAGLTIERAVCTDTGSIDPDLAIASVDVRNGFGSSVSGVDIRRLEQSSPSGGDYVPRHAIHVDAGAEGSIEGVCRSWSESPIANEAGEGMRVSCRDPG